MSYNPKNWSTGEVIESTELNNIENGIAGVLSTQIVSSATVVGHKSHTLTNTSGGSFTLTVDLPDPGDWCIVVDLPGTWEDSNLTIDENSGNNIQGDSTFICDVNRYMLFLYNNGTEIKVR